MEDEEWEDVLVCSYLTPPDALGPKTISSSEVEKFLQRKDWAHVVETKKNKPKCVVAKMINKAYQAGKTSVEDGDNMFACRSSLKGYDMMIGWANTVVHVSKNLEARVHPIATEDTENKGVRFAIEQFGHLFI